MIKLYVDISGGEHETSREYEISNELAEFLRLKSWYDEVDDMTEEDKTCDEFDLDMDNEWVEDILKEIRDEKIAPESILKELESIDTDAFSVADELAVENIIEVYPPEDWDVGAKMDEDMEAGLFVPSLSFEQYLKDDDWDTSDEDFDEEYAKEEYRYKIEEEYEDWVKSLPAYERAERYELDTMMVDCYAEKSYMFNRIDKAAKE